ncbi:MAG TPA: FliG C-terminal domain-containing protein, partial [Pirellulaceae bacterium]|nr:FliG C-terminal domain-containing protein [Pirellulaceae bacterium]
TASESASSSEKKTTDSGEPPMIAGRIHVVDASSRRASDGESVKASGGSTASDAAGNANEWPNELVEVARLDDAQLAAVLRAAEPLVVVLALAGAPPEVDAEFRARWSTREARLLERQIQRLGTWQIDDARRAQEQLVAVAREVVRRSRPVPPSNGPRRVA